MSQNDFDTLVGASCAFAPGRFVTAIVRLQDIACQEDASRERDDKGARFENLSGPALEGTLTWAPTLLATVQFTIATAIEGSTRVASTGFRRTNGGMRVDHELLRNVIPTGDAQIARRDFQNPDQSVTERILTLGARWLINRNLALHASDACANRFQASGTIPEWDRHLVQVRLRLAL